MQKIDVFKVQKLLLELSIHVNTSKWQINSVIHLQWTVGVRMFQMQKHQEKTQSKKLNISVCWTLTLQPQFKCHLYPNISRTWQTT